MGEEKCSAYEIAWGKGFLKELKGIIKGGNQRIKKQVEEAVEELSRDPYHKRAHADIKLISTREEAVYRIRLGKYRMVYEVDEPSRTVFVTMLFIRGDGYR